jgi:hypothetical protein
MARVTKDQFTISVHLKWLKSSTQNIGNFALPNKVRTANMLLTSNNYLSKKSTSAKVMASSRINLI